MVEANGRQDARRSNTNTPGSRGFGKGKYGDTIVLAGVKFRLAQPYPDRPAKED